MARADPLMIDSSSPNYRFNLGLRDPISSDESMLFAASAI